MYTREILPPRASPIEDGNPLYGTWNRAFEKVDLLEIRKAYRYSLPGWIRNFRIKEWESFSAGNEDIMLEATFSNVKLYRIAEVLLYDRKNEEKFIFRKLIPGTGWTLPQSLANASLDSHSSNFYFRIHSWLDADTVKLDINIEANRRHPSLTAHLAYNVSSQDVTPMAVSLKITGQRMMYAYKALAPVRGDIVYKGRHTSLKEEDCSGFFCDYKGFFPYRMQTIICNAMGFDEENGRFGFHIAENQTIESNRNNENALWVNGQLTPLPPVLITMPGGIDSDWVIQDVEGMVDLVFTPIEQNKNVIEMLFTSAEFNSPLGHYNGMLVNSEGKQIQIKNLFGIGEKLNLRV
uniref:DUF2804 domain-containing protein n=1 Tax=uncultured bacterium contig00027 TaxID=1181516 RepID=A0A806K110_9BACT|nr:hypothetical protein [uncultured bacterium contig00027]